jgi:hypothetical protein
MVDMTPADLGFPPAQVRTWDAQLPRETRVLVPVHVDVLLVRNAGGEWADCRMRTPAETGSTRTIDLLPPPFADLAAPRPRGAHLHWAAADALATLQGGGAAPAASPLPDRWLVARLAPGPGALRSVRAWVLDSRAGSSTELKDWTPAPPSGKAVTVLGGGDAGWAAYYANVLNRFAFYDPLTGVPSGPLAYLVCGWYANPADDPLAVPVPSALGFADLVGKLGWAVTGDVAAAHAAAKANIELATKAGLGTPHAALDRTSGQVMFANPTTPLQASGNPAGGKYTIVEDAWPRSSLFHGAVVNLSWPNASATSPDVGGPPDAAAISVALARTPIEALAALVARTASAPNEAEWLTAFAMGALEELNQPDGAARLDDRLHDATFSSRPDGTERVPRQPSAMPPRAPKSEGKPTKGTGWNKTKQADFHGVNSKAQAPPRPAEPTEIELPRPRLYFPSDPVIAIEGGLRSFKHGGDGRFADGTLACRLTGSGVTGIWCKAGPGGERVFVRGGDILDNPLVHGGIPSECEELLEELVALDPGSAAAIAQAVSGQAALAVAATDVERDVETEQTAWWATRNPATDARAILAHSALAGQLPSPIAIRPAARPWVPLHLDWEVELLNTRVSDWTPGEIEFEVPPVPVGAGQKYQGRSLLSGGVASALSDALEKYLSTEATAGGSSIADADETNALEDAAARLQDMDVLAGPLERFNLALRAGVALDAPPAPAPSGFLAVRAGFLRLTQLRLVDAFGQVLYLAGSAQGVAVDPNRVTIGGTAAAGTGVLPLPPRFTAPTKVQFRFRDAANWTADATDDRPPVCGWLMPNHLDGGIEFFDATGSPLGELRLDPDLGTLWEPVPGSPAAFGAPPISAIPDADLAAIAQAIYEIAPDDAAAERPSALRELLRVVDTTRWTIDPFAHAGEEHLALLLGHPIAVVRATLSLDVREPATGSELPFAAVPVRLGSLTHWQDGLLGYFVVGEFQTFRCAAAAAELARPAPADGFLGPIDDTKTYASEFAADVAADTPASPVEHPYVDSSGILRTVPGVEVKLILLLEPHALVHATTCLLPRKQLGVRRAWMAPALGKMAPTFRFGPVLRDPKRIKMPIPADIKGAWSWSHRADVDKWEDEDVAHLGQDATLAPDPVVAAEGWLRLTPPSGGK